MGGDAAPHEVQRMAAFVRSATNENLKVAWYSGRSTMPAGCLAHNFDYIKLGPYVEALGGLQSANSNQRFYKIEAGKMVDATSMFCKK